MKKILIALVFSFTTVTSFLAQTPAPQEGGPEPAAAAPLPVRRVVLYKNGVGYFEHLGTVRNRQDVTIRFTSGQLNDVLKSLTTLDLGKGQIRGISYNSVAPLEQRLGALRLPLGPGATTFDLLGALRGARVEVTSGGVTSVGRLLAVERQQRTSNGDAVTVESFSIVSDTGEVRSFDLTPAVRVRVIERDLRQEVSRYLDLVGSTRERDVRSMVISTAGSGDRDLFVSYISEVPIWKSTYRLVLPAKGKPLLQGWAVIDNTVGEDWNGVELSLVAGAPQSFIQQISQPYYGQRPTVAMPSNVLMRPQTHQATLEGRALDEVAAAPRTQDSIGLTGPPPPPPSAAMGVGTGRGAGAPSGFVGGVVGGLREAAREGAYEEAARVQAAAAGRELGDLFEYRLKEPITLKKNQSALVPIINSEIAAEQVSLWNRGLGSGRPLRAVWITNASGLTLDGGSIAIIDNNAFAGEGLIDPLKPGERRLVSYAADLGVLVRAQQEVTPTRLFRVRAHDGILISETEDRAVTTYIARNENDEPVTLVIEHRMRPQWKLAEGQKPAESTVDTERFRLVIEPGKEGTLAVREVRAGDTRIAIGELTDSWAASGFRDGMFTEETRRALKPVLDKRTQIAGLERQVKTLTQQQQEIVEDQNRVRENMKALRGSAEEKQLLQRYAKQLDEQENRLETLRKELRDANVAIAKAREELATLIAELEFEFSAPQ